MMAERIDIVIPARMGSKGIPHKNRVALCGRPLVAWTIETALAAGFGGRVVVSTDDPEIAAIARAHGAEAPYLRPETLADGVTHPVHAVLHDLQWCEESGAGLPGQVFMLLPTSPFRTGRDLREALDQWRAGTAWSVTGVYEANRVIRATRRMEAPEGFLRPIGLEALGRPHLRRQDVEGYVTINGCLYGSTPERLRECESFIAHDRVLPYRMGQISSIDIDSTEDLWIAERLLPGFLEEAGRA